MPPPSNIISITSPCMRLNGDVLREIFIHCVDFIDYYIFHSPTGLKLSTYYKQRICQLPQLSVSRVCSSWRHVALLTPQLWDNISIYDWTEANLRNAREYLSRAANIPISILLVQGMIAEESWRPQVIDFLSSYRIRAANISNFHLIVPHLPQRSVADLEVLVLRDCYKAQMDLNDTRYPKLAAIRGSIRTITGFSSSLRLFESKEGLDMTIIEGWHLLRYCPSLEECYIFLRTKEGDNSSWPVSTPRIHLQHLRLLHLYPASTETQHKMPFSIFIEALALPVLEQLHAACDRLAVPAFQSLARRSNCFPHLTRLMITYSIVVIDVGALLALTPSLTSLWVFSVVGVIFGNLALDGLASGSVAPRLQSLILWQVHSNFGLFFDMVESRSKNAESSSNGVPASLKEVVLSADAYPHDDNRLKDMQERGIPIETSFFILP